MSSFQGRLRLIEFHDGTPRMNGKPTPPVQIDTNQYKEVLGSVKIENLYASYSALCKQFQNHPQKETLRAIAYKTCKARAEAELPWINQKVMAFEILGNYAMTTQKLDQAQSFAESLHYWQAIKNGLAKWVDPSIFIQTDWDTYTELTTIANPYTDHLEFAEIMMDDYFLNKNNPYAAPSLLHALPLKSIQEIQEALARENE